MDYNEVKLRQIWLPLKNGFFWLKIHDTLQTGSVCVYLKTGVSTSEYAPIFYPLN